MPPELIVDLGRRTLEEVVVLSGPILAVAVIVSLLINIVQVLTSLQESTISTVPRLLASGAAIFFLMPWMWRHVCQFTIGIFSNFGAYVR